MSRLRQIHKKFFFLNQCIGHADRIVIDDFIIAVIERGFSGLFAEEGLGFEYALLLKNIIHAETALTVIITSFAEKRFFGAYAAVTAKSKTPDKQ